LFGNWKDTNLDTGNYTIIWSDGSTEVGERYNDSTTDGDEEINEKSIRYNTNGTSDDRGYDTATDLVRLGGFSSFYEELKDDDENEDCYIGHYKPIKLNVSAPEFRPDFS